ncbi:MAG: hypothetical protein CMH57_08265 [Myxococcales bacterium]|nr:hypothetical protein [Myxococcales bacterium]
MNFRQTRGRAREEVRLELTPLIDVVFLLLLFFLITTTFVRESHRQLPLDLPSAGSGQPAAESQRVVVFVSADGSLQLEDELVRKSEVPERLQRLYSEEPDIQLLIKGDKTTSYGHITDIIDMAKQTGFERVNLVVKPR